MSLNSSIEWTETTWNPILGCSKVSDGCRNCYAIRSVHRMAGNPNAKIRAANEGLTVIRNGAPNWTSRVRLIEDRLTQPMRWRKPRRIFVNSLSDLFHDGLRDRQIDCVFATMAMCPQHTFQVLTKRAGRLHRWATERSGCWLVPHINRYYSSQPTPHIGFTDSSWPLPNVWLGVSVEDQKTADERIPLLMQTPAAVRWISAEPLLGPLDLSIIPRCMDDNEPSAAQIAPDNPLACHFIRHGAPGLDWTVVGGESGPGARPMNPEWVRSIRDQCQAAGVPFFFKQWGDWMPCSQARTDEQIGFQGELCDPARFDGAKVHAWPDKTHSVWIGKKRAGAMLDGREWREMPR